MSHQPIPRWIVDVAVVIVAGLGLGLGAARFWRADSALPAQEPGRSDASRPVQETAEPSRALKPDPGQSGPAITRRALLIGVTKYDNLPRDKYLEGPANDVRLMRRLLEERYRFPADGIVSLTEDETTPERRPTRANIEREFHRLADQAREGDQVAVLMAGHGSQQPESDPPDPANPEPDGLDEIFLPADIGAWKGTRERLPGAIVDDDIGAWLRSIAAKRAYVWAVFDCCHSGTMTRGTERIRELPPELLVPREELARARERASRRQGQERTRGGPPTEPPSFAPREASDYLVAVYACRPTEVTPESLEPEESPDATYHGLLTYSLVHVLTEAADAQAPPTYRELVRRLQVQYAGRPQGSPTPLVEGKGQDRIVLGTEEVVRSPLVLTRDRGVYKVNAGDLYGLTRGSILAVDSATATGSYGKPRLLGHVQVVASRPFDATVEPCAHDGSPPVQDLAPFSTCRVVSIDCALRRFKVAIDAPQEPESSRLQLQKALQPLADSKTGLVKMVDDPRQADWIVRIDQGKAQLVEASGNRPPFALPAPESPELGKALRQSLEKIDRARNLVSVSSRFESERARGASAVNVEVEVLRHKNDADPGEVYLVPAGGYIFRPGDLISFRLHNKSPSILDVTLLIVGSDFEINAFYPQPGDVGQSLDPGQTFSTPAPWGQISKDPPFGPEHLVVIATPATNPPTDFTALTQGGLVLARGVNRTRGLQSPLGQLLESAMFGKGTRGPLGRSVSAQHGMRVLNWRTEPGAAHE